MIRFSLEWSHPEQINKKAQASMNIDQMAIIKGRNLSPRNENLNHLTSQPIERIRAKYPAPPMVAGGTGDFLPYLGEKFVSAA